MKFPTRIIAVLACILGLIYTGAGCSYTTDTPPQSSFPELVVSETAKEPIKKEITITLDNWNTYFEFVEKEEEYKNKYNEIEHIQHYYSFDLKDQYTLDKMDLEVDYSYLYTLYSVQEDLTNKKIIWGDIIEGPTETTRESNIRYDECSVAGEAVVISGSSKPKCTDFKVNRIYGTLVIID